VRESVITVFEITQTLKEKHPVASAHPLVCLSEKHFAASKDG
jgi:hypothetical protein